MPKIISECRELVKLCDINIVVVRFFTDILYFICCSLRDCDIDNNYVFERWTALLFHLHPKSPLFKRLRSILT